jgi:hypothetical protein
MVLIRSYSEFPIWFVVHDRRGLFFERVVIFVLLHRFASNFFSPPSVFHGTGGCFEAILAAMLFFSRM